MMVGRTKREVVEAYNALGGRTYDLRYAEEQESKYLLLLKRVQPETTDVVLDVGCGTGLLLQKLNSRNVGLDISPRLLSAARSKVGSLRKDELVQADAENLPFRDSVFNNTYSVTLIQNTPNPVKAIMEMKRVSRQGSKLAITALKKGFSEGRFASLFEGAGLKSASFVFDDGLKDWVAFAVP